MTSTNDLPAMTPESHLTSVTAPEQESPPASELSPEPSSETGEAALEAELSGENQSEENQSEESQAEMAQTGEHQVEGDTPTPTVADLQVRFKVEDGQLLLLLPPDPDSSRQPLSWGELYQQLRQRLESGDRFWQPRTTVHLMAQDRLLDGRQLQTIAEALTNADLYLERIYTSRRQTAMAAVTAGYSVDQQADFAHLVQSPVVPGQPLDDPLYLQTTVRSGGEIRHAGTIIILGDVNPGSSLVADGDILVWGRLRGVAHAGARGNRNCRIMALQMQPTQLRIAGMVARAPESPPGVFTPEVAYIGQSGIRIATAVEFARSCLSRPLDIASPGGDNPGELSE